MIGKLEILNQIYETFSSHKHNSDVKEDGTILKFGELVIKRERLIFFCHDIFILLRTF